MSNTTTDLTINLINNISSQLNHYMTLIIFLFGSIGNLLNIIVLSQPTLRMNPCVLYFLISSISSLGILLVGLPSRLIAIWTSTDPSSTSSWFCKFRIFFLYSFRTTTSWLLVCATIDRWFLSHRKIHRRRLSSYKTAWKLIFIICALSFILWFESIFCYDANVANAPLQCYGKSTTCRIFNDIVYASSTVSIPSILMLIFGFLTIHNINRSLQAVQPVMITIVSDVSRISRNQRRGIRRSESSLTRMHLLQVFLLTLCSIPQALHQFYLTFTMDIYKSPLRIAIENFIVSFNFSLTYVGNGITFYIYTLNGTIFRETFIQLLHTFIRKFKF
ncbi:unnamed protein product [Adineta steineri]|uniref:G-protein coupled receptors family 1 profile domain-containing protein n=1 Tax=Adineta steineri TaxID=433720 RepID=A0A818TD75_9BILA|nr:unnamed protein product [Adineta steineri]CAF3681698.1 unnamed protein product [Adineta steineri]